MKDLLITIMVAFLGLNMGSCISAPNRNIEIWKVKYREDSTYLHGIFKKMIAKSKRPFIPKAEFDEGTLVFIDTIVYNHDLTKAAILVITENSNSKLLSSPFLSNSHFNGNYFLGLRNNINEPLRVYEYSAWGIIHVETFPQIKKELRKECFEMRGGQRWNNHESKYNFTDSRFWNSSEFETLTTGDIHLVIDE